MSLTPNAKHNSEHTHQFDLIVFRERGELKERSPDNDGDELDGHGHEQLLVDVGFQVHVVGQQQEGGDDGHGDGGEVDVPNAVGDVVVGEYDLEQPVVVLDLDAQQLLHLGRDHVDGRAGREPADQRLGQYRAHDAQPEHVHEYLYEADHQSDGRGHLDGRVHGGRVVRLQRHRRVERRTGRGIRARVTADVIGVGGVVDVGVCVHHLAGHQANHRKRSHRNVLGRAQQAVNDHRHDGHVQADGRVHVAEHGVRHALRYVQHGHREPGHEVLEEILGPVVVGEQPIDCRHHRFRVRPLQLGHFFPLAGRLQVHDRAALVQIVQLVHRPLHVDHH